MMFGWFDYAAFTFLLSMAGFTVGYIGGLKERLVSLTIKELDAKLKWEQERNTALDLDNARLDAELAEAWGVKK